MKIVQTLFFTCLFCLGVHAQKDYTQSLDGIEWIRIDSKSDIVVKAHKNNNLLIKGGEPVKVPEKAKGLTLVGEGGTDNTGIGYFVERQGNSLIVKNLDRNKVTQIFLPASQNISVESHHLNDIEITGFTGEVEASAEVVGNITILDVTGPLTVHSNTGTVKVVFSKLDQNAPTTISTTTGTVDMTLPEDTPASLTMKSTMGEIYTDFDIALPEKEGLKAISTQQVNGTLNGGGGSVQVHSATGNIFLRKK